VDKTGLSEIPAPTLELLILKTLDLGGAMPAYGIGQFIQATSEEVLQVDAQMLYRALQKMLDNGLLAAEREPGAERGRRYRLTAEGRERLRRSAHEFRRLAQAVTRMLSIR
jgi:DNA-binding PadR family transcriptional regulator